MVQIILWFSFILAMQTKFGNLTRISGCTAKGHLPFLLRNFVVLVSLVIGLLGVHQGEQPGNNNHHHRHLHSLRLSLPHLRLPHGPLPSTFLGLLLDMLLIRTNPCTSRARLARLGLVKVVASGPCLLVLTTETWHLHNSGCTCCLVGLPSLSR
jgi:hypothetical protein